MRLIRPFTGPAARKQAGRIIRELKEEDVDSDEDYTQAAKTRMSKQNRVGCSKPLARTSACAAAPSFAPWAERAY